MQSVADHIPTERPISDAPDARPTPATGGAPSAFSEALHSPWLKVGVLAVVFGWLFLDNLTRLWAKTNLISGDRNWYHAMTIPLVGLYYLFLHREELLALPVEPVLGDRFSRSRFVSVAIAAGLAGAGYLIAPWLIPGLVSLTGLGSGDASIVSLGTAIARYLCLGLMLLSGLALVLDWGFACLLGGLALSAYGIYPGQNDFVWDGGMVLTLFGAVLTLTGWRIMRIVWFPIAFLVCAIPWPPLIYSAMAMPLQRLAAKASVGILNLCGVDASYAGTKIFLPLYNEFGVRMGDRPLNVAEACAGLVSLMSFISIAAAIAFLSSRPLWQKLVITASAVPIAIACNVLRVAGVGILDLYAGREWSEGFAHQFAGMVLLLPAFFLIMLVCWAVDQVFVEEADDQPTPAGGGE